MNREAVLESIKGYLAGWAMVYDKIPVQRVLDQIQEFEEEYE